MVWVDPLVKCLSFHSEWLDAKHLWQMFPERSCLGQCAANQKHSLQSISTCKYTPGMLPYKSRPIHTENIIYKIDAKLEKKYNENISKYLNNHWDTGLKTQSLILDAIESTKGVGRDYFSCVLVISMSLQMSHQLMVT